MSVDEQRSVSPQSLRQLGRDALNGVGVENHVADPVIDGLIWANMRGIDSHGMRLLPHYVEGVKAGRLNPSPEMTFDRTAAATGLLDADHTFGHVAGVKAMKLSIEMAEESGIGAVSVGNSSHCGALSYFAHFAAEQDMIGIVFTHATSRVKSPGSTRAFFGNNPICLVAPMRDEDPFCFDAATTGITFNAVKAAASAGEVLSPGLVADSSGNETTDPSKAEQLLPIGDYKGFGLSMMVEILTAVLSGMPNGDRVSKMFGDPLSQKRKLGHFFCALRISAFRDVEDFKSDLQDMAERVREEPAISPEAGGVRVPGDPEKAHWRERSARGITMPMHDWKAILAVAGQDI